jgi:tetratricopeptide (TPR) repeat protein
MKLLSIILALILAGIVLVGGPAQALAQTRPQTEMLDADAAQAALWQDATGAFDAGDAATAEPLFRRFVAAAKAEPSPIDVVNGLDLLGGTLMQLGRFEEAEAVLSEAVDLRRRDPHLDPLALAESLTALATARQFRGDFPQAGPAFREALALRRGTLGATAPLTLTSVKNLADFLLESGAYVEAEALAQQASAGFTVIHGPGSTEVARALSTLGGVQFRLGRYPEAESTLRQALAVQLEKVDADPILTGHIRNSLGLLLSEQGRNAEAETQLRLVVTLYETHLGPDHLSMLTARSNLSLVLLERGEKQEGESLALQVLLDRIRLLGEDHPDTALSRAQFAVRLQQNGFVDDAEDMMVQSIRGQMAARGRDSPVVAYSLRQLVDILIQNRKLEDAESFARSGVAILTKALGAGHVDVAISSLQLGSVLEARQTYGEARTLYASAAATYLANWCEPGSTAAPRWGSRACPGNPQLTQAVVNMARIELNYLDRPTAATRRAAIASDMTVGRTRARYARDPEGRAEFDRFRVTHAGFVTAAWKASHP